MRRWENLPKAKGSDHSVHEFLRLLKEEDRILDLGSASGSFPSDVTAGSVVRVDLDFGPESHIDDFLVKADAAFLPFLASAFDLVVANHSLEHFADVTAVVGEIGRVIKPDGYLYVAVPDASTFADRLYRWMGRGGGHISAIYRAQEVADVVTAKTSLQVLGVRTLYSSFSFLNRKNVGRAGWRMRLLGGGFEPFVSILAAAVRIADRVFGTRWAQYGWAIYFGSGHVEIDERASINVCVRCGSGHRADRLNAYSRRVLLIPCYECPNCLTLNVLFRDRD